jgi:hypothetical protein
LHARGTSISIRLGRTWLCGPRNTSGPAIGQESG